VQGQTPTFRFIDLFAGLGGFHLALEQLGGQCVFAAEWEPTLNALYEKNYDLQPWSDINTLDSDAVIAAQVPDHDVLAAGFPCQPFSKSGSQLGFEHTAQGRLFFAVLAILRVKKPSRFILENVPNILKHQDGKTLGTIRGLLEQEGYAVDVEQYSPDQFGIPQVRHRAYFVGSRDGLEGFTWPERGTDPTTIETVIAKEPQVVRSIPERTEYAIDMWGDFLRRSGATRLSSSWPLWSMEFGATYPFEDETPARIWKRRKVRGFNGLGFRGDFGVKLDGLTLDEQYDKLPSHARREEDLEFPRWKQTYIRQNREFYDENRSWIDPWMREWKPWELPSSFQKFEWNAQGGDRNIDKYVLQIRASGVRVKRPHTAPSLIAMTQTQVPILGSKLSGGARRYMTVEECAMLQSLGGIELPESDIAAYRALGNAVNAKVVRAIADPLLEGLDGQSGPNSPADGNQQTAIEILGAIA
jgi:DNA (cytosine-5)-methyltransferase 1